MNNKIGKPFIMSYLELLKIYYILGNIYYYKYRKTAGDTVSWVNKIQLWLIEKWWNVHAVPRDLIVIILRNSGIKCQFSDSVILTWSEKKSVKWRKVVFFQGYRTHQRVVKEIQYPWMPKCSLLISETLMQNIKCNLNDCDNLPWYISLGPVIDIRSLPTAKSIDISPTNNFNSMEVEMSIENYLKHHQICQIGDIITLDPVTPTPLGILNKQIYFKVNEITLESQTLKEQYIIINTNTRVYTSSQIHSKVPTCNYYLLKSFQLSSINTIVPLGLQDQYKVISSWFSPFFNHPLPGLKPIFLLCGEVENLLLESTSKKLGVRLRYVDSNTLIASTSAQIRANILSAFPTDKPSSPAIVDLRNIELLCSDPDNDASSQVISCLCERFNSLHKESSQIVIVITCSQDGVSKLPDGLLSLVLARHNIPILDASQRESALIWLCRCYSLRLDDKILHHLVTETTSFSFSDLRRLLSLADLQRYKSGRIDFDIDDFSSPLESLSKVERVNVGDIEWEDVGGVDHIKKTLLSSLRSAGGGLRRTGLLLHGPPGTGKTMLARVVASRLSASFLPVKGPELLNMYIGQSEANVRQVFRRAKDASPCVLFFDELDSLAPARGNRSSGGVTDRVVSQVLSEMDGLDSDEGVFVLAATNRPDLVDPALLRPGRFDKMIYVGPLKERDSKLKVLKAVMRKFVLTEEFDLNKAVDLLPDEVTGAQVSAICYNAWMDAARSIIRSGEVIDGIEVEVNLENIKAALQFANTKF